MKPRSGLSQAWWAHRGAGKLAPENTVAAIRLGAQHGFSAVEFDAMLSVDGVAVDVGPGQALCIPRGAVHRFDNRGGGDARALCIISPAAIGPEYFRESAAVLASAAGGPPDRARLAEIMHRHGLTPVAS